MTETFWEILTPADREVLRAAGTILSTAPDTVIMREGEQTRHIVVLLAGWVRLISNSANGHETVLALRGPGDVLGEMAAIRGPGVRPRPVFSTRVITVGTAVLLSLSNERFIACLNSHSRIQAALLQVLTDRVRESDLRRLELSSASSATRVARLLNELSMRYGTRAGAGIEISLPISQQELGGLVGASRETVARALRDLRQQGVIATSRRHISILRPDLLDTSTD